ncbi:MAG: hypothetical protein IJW22_01370, partial [Clostridia bacterium]|nr:hypothetical protein [Clostridia bacterium]
LAQLREQIQGARAALYLRVQKRFGTYPKTLVFAFAKLIEFYKTSTPNDDPAVMQFMRERSVADILANTDFWGEDLSDLLPEVTSC